MRAGNRVEFLRIARGAQCCSVNQSTLEDFRTFPSRERMRKHFLSLDPTTRVNILWDSEKVEEEIDSEVTSIVD